MAERFISNKRVGVLAGMHAAIVAGERSPLECVYQWGRVGSGKSGGVRVVYFTRTAAGEVVLLTLYAKAKTDNITGSKLKEIRRALEE